MINNKKKIIIYYMLVISIFHKYLFILHSITVSEDDINLLPFSFIAHFPFMLLMVWSFVYYIPSMFNNLKIYMHFYVSLHFAIIIFVKISLFYKNLFLEFIEQHRPLLNINIVSFKIYNFWELNPNWKAFWNISEDISWLITC